MGSNPAKRSVFSNREGTVEGHLQCKYTFKPSFIGLLPRWKFEGLRGYVDSQCRGFVFLDALPSPQPAALFAERHITFYSIAARSPSLTPKAVARVYFGVAP